MPHSVAPDLVLHCLSVFHIKDSRLIWVNKRENNKGADQTVEMRRLICPFLVCIQQSQVFSQWSVCYSLKKKYTIMVLVI